MPDVIRTQGEISAEIPLDDHQLAWKRQQEHTASEPSQLSFSHYKLSATDNLLGLIDARLREIPLTTGLVPQAWCHITDVEILKKANVFNVDKMRLIQLMASDFNINNKMIGRRMMAQAESCGTLADDQYGSRKQRRSAIAALPKRLTMDLWRQQRRAGAICMNDAKSCYDRIVHSVASICMQRQGVPAKTCQSLFGTLQQAVHRISTGFGVSEPTYGGKSQVPPVQGAGQGSGKAPAIWAVVSSVLIEMMYSAGHGMCLLSALTCTVIRLVCFAFVDDTDTVQTGPTKDSSGEEVVPLMQHGVDCWEGGLWTSGGALVPSKSFWFLIDFRWTPKGWRYRTIQEMPGQLLVLNDQRQRICLRRLEPSMGTTTLGIHMAMDGSTKDVVTHLRDQATKFGDAIRTATISKNDAWFTLQSSFMKTMEYPVTACNILKSEWEYILAPALRHALPKCGLARNCPRSVLYGPKSHQGLGMIHPYYKQMITHLQVWFNAFMEQSTTARLLQGVYEGLKCELGIPDTLGTIEYERYNSMTTQGWIQSLWQFLWSNHMDVFIDDDFPTLLRDNDQYLMKSFGENNRLTNGDLRKVNECRMFLNVLTIADVTTVDGTHIDPAVLRGWQCSSFRSNISWPRQPPQLPSAHWSIWRTALRGIRSAHTALQTPLGAWHEHVRLSYHWDWWIHHLPQSSVIFHRERSANAWTKYDPVEGPHRPSLRRAAQAQATSFHCHQQAHHHDLPPTSIPVSITWQTPTRESLRVISWGEPTKSTNSADSSVMDGSRVNPDPTTQFLTMMTQIRDDDSHPLDVFAVANPSVSYLAQALQAGTLRAVSDGSYKNGQGSAAWVIAGEEEATDYSLSGAMWVTGGRMDQNSFRSELGGVLGILMCVQELRKAFGITTGQLEIGLDGKSAIDAIQKPGPIRATQQSTDLLQSIRAHMTELTVSWKWVEGHQLEKTNQSLADLDWWGRANTAVDLIAKQHLNHGVASERSSVNQLLPGESFAISHEGIKLAQIHEAQLYSDLMLDEICSYWAEKHDIDWDDIDTIDWKASGIQRWHAKFASGHCGVGRMELLRKHQSHMSSNASLGEPLVNGNQHS